ncbi:cytochrome P450 [Fusarium acuminatum]|uniref:Cytochrome P450 n=1 Tax=Fusarium acuminatum TaxID=5515 RepID=A0ABZ2X0V8_9HYPO
MSTLTLQGLSLPFVILSVLILGSILLYSGYRTRRFYRNLPGPPHSWLFGHLKVMHEIAALMPPNCHPQLYYTEITHRYNIQGIFYLDLWPIGPGTVVITDPKLIELAPTPKPLPVHPQTDAFLSLMVGNGSIAALNGVLWKKMHNAMSPVFSATHVRNLTGVMVDEAVVFRSQLEKLSDTGKTFPMEEVVSRVLFDIVARVIFNVPLHAQTTGSQIHADLRGLVNLARQETDIRVAYNPIIQISRRWRRRQVVKKIELSLLNRIYNRLELLLSQGDVPSRQNLNSILDLILREYIEDSIRKGDKGHEEPVKLSKDDEVLILSK